MGRMTTVRRMRHVSGLAQFTGHLYTEPLHKTRGKAPVVVATGAVPLPRR